MIDGFLSGDSGTAPTNVPALLLSLLLAFLAGHVVAWVYMLTHSGLSYSRSFVNSLVVLPMIVSLVMGVLSNNLVIAFGLMAIFAIVRFRNILRDTLDTTYILASIVAGMACGTQKFATAVIGTAVVAAVLVYLRLTLFGSRHRYDYILNLHVDRPLAQRPEVARVLQRHSLRVHCASQRTSEGYPGTDLSYRLLLRDSERAEDLLTELRTLEGVSRVTGLTAEDESEM